MNWMTKLVNRIFLNELKKPFSILYAALFLFAGRDFQARVCAAHPSATHILSRSA
jgi:hypothetical protein